MQGNKGVHIGVKEVNQFGNELQDMMSTGFEMIAKSIQMVDTMIAQNETRESSFGVPKFLKLIDKIDAQIEKVKRSIHDGKDVERNARRLRILEKTLDRVYAALEVRNEE